MDAHVLYCLDKNAKHGLMRGILCLGVAFAFGCGPASHIQRRHATEFGCASESVRVEKISGNQYDVNGCGVRGIYVCGQTACVRDSQPTSTVGPPATSTSSRSTERRNERNQTRIEFAREDGRRIAVRASFQAREATLVVTYAPRTSHTDATVAVSGANLGECDHVTLLNAAGRLHIDLSDGEGRVGMRDLRDMTQSERPLARVCGRSWALQLGDVQGFARFIQAARELAQGSQSQPEQPRDSTTEAAIRERLNEKASVIRACMGSTEPIAVESNWTVSGTVTLRVRGNEDDAVNACIEDGVGAWTLTPESEGRLIHVIQPTNTD